MRLATLLLALSSCFGATFVNSSAVVAGPNGGTSSATNMTGAQTLILVTSGVATTYSSAGAGCSTSSTLCDSLGNTYVIAGTGQAQSPTAVYFWVSTSPTVSSSMTFTVNQTSGFLSFTVYGFSNMDSSPYESANSGCSANGSATSFSPATITPAENGDVIISGITVPAPSSAFANAGLTIGNNSNYSGGNNYGGASGYVIQGAATAFSTPWTWTTSAAVGGCNLTFKTSSGPPPPSTTLSSIQPSPTQAILAYHTGTAGACTVEVSQSNTYSPLAFDVDGALYTNANLDSREPYLQFVGERVFVAGKRIVQRDLNGIPRSRALQANTLYYHRITCGSDVLTGTFTTGTQPIGLSYADAIPIDALSPGDPLWPAPDYGDKTKAYIEPGTGIPIKYMTGMGDQEQTGGSLDITFGSGSLAKYPTGGAWSATSFPTTVTNNSTDYLFVHLDTNSSGAAGGLDLGEYTLGNNYSAEIAMSLNNVQTSITGSVNQASCGASDCKLVACLTVNRVTCHNSAALLDVAFTNSSGAHVIGDQTYANQGGWIKPGYRPINSVEAAKRTGSAVCNGTTTVTGGPFNLTMTAGSIININMADYTVASVQHEAQITLGSTCAAGSFTFVSKNFGILLRAKTTNANTFTLTAGSAAVHVGLAPSAPAGQTEDICSFTTVNDVSGKPGYNCFMNNGVVWVSSTTGEGRYIIPGWIIDASGYHGLGYSQMTFDGTDADTLYGVTSSSTARIFKYTYKGDHANTGYANETPATVCNDPVAPSNKPCLVVTELTAGLSDSADLVHNFNPAFDKTKWVGVVIGTNQYHGAFIFQYKRNNGSGGPQNQSYAWFTAFDPSATTNSRPSNAGCVGAALGNSNPGCMIGVMAAYASPWIRGMNSKSATSNVDVGVVASGPYFTCLNGTANGAGCAKVDIGGGFSFSNSPASCPANPYGIVGNHCTVVTVSGEPYDADPGSNETGAPGEYLTAAVGDIFCVSCTTVGGGGTQLQPNSNAYELVRLLVKSGTTWTLQRAFQYGFSTPVCPGQNCQVGAASALTSGANPSLWYSSYSGAWYWDFVNDPTGAATVLDQYDQGVHAFSRRGVASQSSAVPTPPCPDSTSGCYMTKYSPTVITPGALAAIAPTGFQVSNPPFGGKFGVAVINGTQSHVSAPGLSAPEPMRAEIFDNRPFNGIYTSSAGAPTASSVSGSLYKFAAGAITLDRKYLPTHATNGVWLLTDVSGPASSIGTTSTDYYKYCVVIATNECRSGSAAGEIYFNVPFMQFNYCYEPGQATSGADNTDICIVNQTVADDAIMQMNAIGNDAFGTKQRVLSRALATPRVNSPFWDMFVTPASVFAVTRSKFIQNFRSDWVSIQMPPLNGDSQTRTGFIPISISVPTSPLYSYAQVEWGYVENGSDGLTKFYCTSRADNCRSGGTPYTFASESQTPTSCATTCTVKIQAVAGREVYYRILRTDSGGSVLATGETKVRPVQ